MANTFKSFGAEDIGTSDISVYTVPASTQAVVLGITAANILSTTILVTAKITKGGSTYFIVKDAPVLAGSSLEVMGAGSKLVAEAADIIKIVSDTATSVDATVSMLEIT